MSKKARHTNTYNYELLHSLGQTLAMARDRDALFNTIFEKVEPVIGFDRSANIFIIEPNGRYYSFFFKVSDYGDEEAIVEPLLQQKFPVTDPVFRNIMDAGAPLLMDLEETLEKYPDQWGFNMMRQLGLQQAMTIPLKVGQKPIGCLTVHSYDKNRFSEAQFNIFQGIANYVAIAVANIMANEEIFERQHEKEMLLSIGKDIAKIRSKRELWKVISNKLEPIFNFHSSVTVITVNQTHHKHFMFTTPHDVGEHPKHKEVLESIYPNEGSTWDWQLALEGPHIIYLEDMMKMDNSHKGYQMMKDLGLTESFGCPLSFGGKKFGFLWFHYRKGILPKEKLQVFGQVANQVAAAVFNILANEEILERQKEKELLLKVSEQLGRTQNKQKFWEVLMQTVQPIFGFHTAVIVVSRDKNRHETFLLQEPESTKEAKNHNATIAINPNEGSPYPFNLESDKAAIVPLKEWAAVNPEYPGALLMQELGLTESFRAPLFYMGEKFGLLWFHYKENQLPKERLKLFANISNYVAATVSNILANEEILEREREKQALLSISEDVASIRNREELYGVITNRLQSSIPFQDAVVISVDHKQKVFRHILNLANFDRKQHPLFSEVITQSFSLEEAGLDIILKQPEFGLLDITAEHEKNPNFPGWSMMLDTNLNYSYFFPLNSGGKLIGGILFHFSERFILPDSQKGYIKSAVNQIAIAVSNILANDSLELKNRVNAFQANMANIFNTEATWAKKYLELSKTFQSWMPFDLVGYSLTDGEGYETFFLERLGAKDYRHMPALSFAKICHVTVVQLNEAIHAHENQIPSFANESDFKALAINDTFIRMAQKYFKLRSCLRMTLSSNHGRSHQLVFFSKQPESYLEEHIGFANTIAHSLALILDKHLSHNKIMGLTERLRQEKDYLQEEINITYNFKEIVGSSTALKESLVKVQQVAKSDTTVLITGETGTGKELFARALHDYSNRKNKAMVKVNCATLPPQLMESELFGHEKGSFTGADRQRLGKFEFANGGTIFLDEIGEMPFDMQAKLLRILQEKEFERLGGNRTIKVDVRIVAATNRNLSLEVEKGNFRADLFYRLNVFPIPIPPLRERKEDITPLALHFLKKSIRKLGKDITGISSASLKELLKYTWPGNVRELEHIIERSVIVNQGSTLQVKMDQLQVLKGPGINSIQDNPFAFKKLKDVERETILNTLHFCNGRIRGTGGAAEILDINPQTLESRMKRLGIEKEHVFKGK